MSATDAGREMDALVAERIMGYVWEHFPEERYAIMRVPGTNWCAVEQHDGEEPHYAILPEFSTDVAAALDVLAQLGGIITLARMSTAEWRAEIGGHLCWAETLPLAICRAALAAVEVLV